MFACSTRLFGIAVAIWLAACASSVPPPTAGAGEPTHRIFAASNGWHSSILLRRSNVPAGRIPEAEDFPDAAYLAISWGDRAYFPARQPTIGMALAAGLLPTPSAIHLVALAGPRQKFQPDDEILSIPLTAAGFERLIAQIDAAFDRPRGGRAASVAPGLYPNSRFYPARGSFHLLNTCNTWVARHLAQSGVPLTPTGIITAGHLMEQLRAQPGVTSVEESLRERVGTR